MKLTYKDDGHQYWLDGVRCKGVTSVAKIPDDPYGLHLWDNRMMAIGFSKSPDLVERVAAHYDDYQLLNRICDEAKTVAKAYVASGRGTAAHRITERHDLDELVIDTALSLAVRKLWDECLAQAGLEVVPEFIERIVVFPDERVCGRIDRYCRRHSDGRLVVVDLKTGENAIKYPHAISCQMGMYVNAPLMAGPLPPEGGTTSVFEPLPGELDRETGVIIHMPAEDRAEAVNINIADGWAMIRDHVFPILKWRKRNDLVQRTQLIPTVGSSQLPSVGPDGPGPLTPLRVVPDPSTIPGDDGPVDITTVTTSDEVHQPVGSGPSGVWCGYCRLPWPCPSSSGGAVEQKSGPSTAPAPSTTAGAQPGVSPPTNPHCTCPDYCTEHGDGSIADQMRLDWIKMRMKAIRDAGHGDFLRANWPDGITNPPTDDDVNRIADACSAVEDMFEMQWQPIDPLFASFAQAKEDPVIRPMPVPDVFKHVGENYRYWADRGKQLLADLDDLALARAVIQVCRIEKGTPMTAELYQRLEAVTNQLTHPEGAIYAVADGPDSWQILASVEHAANRMIDAVGSKEAAYVRARRLAKQIGLPKPTDFALAEDQPLLVALVAEGHGASVQ